MYRSQHICFYFLLRDLPYLSKVRGPQATWQGIHKRMVRFQKLMTNLFPTLHRHSIHCQFLMRFQQFASHAHCGASFQDGVAAGEGFLCAPS
jgi:hypothetical protein